MTLNFKNYVKLHKFRKITFKMFVLLAHSWITWCGIMQTICNFDI